MANKAGPASSESAATESRVDWSGILLILALYQTAEQSSI